MEARLCWLSWGSYLVVALSCTRTFSSRCSVQLNVSVARASRWRMCPRPSAASREPSGSAGFPKPKQSKHSVVEDLTWTPRPCLELLLQLLNLTGSKKILLLARNLPTRRLLASIVDVTRKSLGLVPNYRVPRLQLRALQVLCEGGARTTAWEC